MWISQTCSEENKWEDLKLKFQVFKAHKKATQEGLLHRWKWKNKYQETEIFHYGPNHCNSSIITCCQELQGKNFVSKSWRQKEKKNWKKKNCWKFTLNKVTSLIQKQEKKALKKKIQFFSKRKTQKSLRVKNGYPYMALFCWSKGHVAWIKA